MKKVINAVIQAEAAEKFRQDTASLVLKHNGKLLHDSIYFENPEDKKSFDKELEHLGTFKITIHG